MKYLNLPKQFDTNTRTLAFTYFSAQVLKERFNITPLLLMETSL